jgi:transcriptional regulator with XRE-family HTH domain
VPQKSPNPTDKHVGSRVRMRRMMLSMSLEKLGDALGLTFQQVQKYEKGVNRIGASRLQHISHILQVPVPFFFEGAPTVTGVPVRMSAALSPDYVADFFATSHGLALTKAFMRIRRRSLGVVLSTSWNKSLPMVIIAASRTPVGIRGAAYYNQVRTRETAGAAGSGSSKGGPQRCWDQFLCALTNDHWL